MISERMKNEPGDSFPELTLDDSRERVEEMWRQTLSQRSSARAELASARADRSRAELERQRVATHALEATKEACRKLISEAERKLSIVKQAEASAEAKVAEAEKAIKQAGTVRAEADSYREKAMAEAQQDAQRIRDEARAAALQECANLKRHVANEVQCILKEIDTVRAAAQEELEAQRIYAEAANLDMFAREIEPKIMGRVNGASGNGMVLAENHYSDNGAQLQDAMGGGQVYGVEVRSEPGPGASQMAEGSEGPQHSNDGPMQARSHKKGQG